MSLESILASQNLLMLVVALVSGAGGVGIGLLIRDAERREADYYDYAKGWYDGWHDGHNPQDLPR